MESSRARGYQMGIWGGRVENLEKRACSKQMQEKSKPAPFAKGGAKGCGTQESHRVKGVRPALFSAAQDVEVLARRGAISGRFSACGLLLWTTVSQGLLHRPIESLLERVVIGPGLFLLQKSNPLGTFIFVCLHPNRDGVLPRGLGSRSRLDCV